jgi:hypothetical protein
MILLDLAWTWLPEILLTCSLWDKLVQAFSTGHIILESFHPSWATTFLSPRPTPSAFKLVLSYHVLSQRILIRSNHIFSTSEPRVHPILPLAATIPLITGPVPWRFDPDTYHWITNPASDPDPSLFFRDFEDANQVFFPYYRYLLWVPYISLQR